jgi:hypothetical protein
MPTRQRSPTFPSRRALLVAPAALLLVACGAGSPAGPAAAPTPEPGAPSSPATSPASASAPPPSAPSPAPPTGTGPATAAGPPRCPTSTLTGSLRAGDAGAGQRSATLVLTNRGDRSCRLDGYGGVQLADAAGRALPTRQVRDPGTPPRSVVLAPGAAGASRLRWAAVPGTELCSEAASLRVIPPDQRSALSVPWSLGPVCDGGLISQAAYRTA